MRRSVCLQLHAQTRRSTGDMGGRQALPSAGDRLLLCGRRRWCLCCPACQDVYSLPSGLWPPRRGGSPAPSFLQSTPPAWSSSLSLPSPCSRRGRSLAARRLLLAARRLRRLRRGWRLLCLVWGLMCCVTRAVARSDDAKMRAHAHTFTRMHVWILLPVATFAAAPGRLVPWTDAQGRRV